MLTFVRIPRAHFVTWWARPWPEVLAAAEAGEDGLAIDDSPDRSERNYAYVYEGDDSWGKGKTLLFQLNW